MSDRPEWTDAVTEMISEGLGEHATESFMLSLRRVLQEAFNQIALANAAVMNREVPPEPHPAAVVRDGIDGGIALAEEIGEPFVARWLRDEVRPRMLAERAKQESRPQLRIFSEEDSDG